VSSCSIPSIKGSEAAPTREGSSPSSLANVYKAHPGVQYTIARERIKGKENQRKQCATSNGPSTYPPFTPRIDNAITKNQTTRATHEIPAAKFLNNVWIWVPTVWTDEANREIRTVSSLKLDRFVALGKRKRLRVCHDFQKISGWNRQKECGPMRQGIWCNGGISVVGEGVGLQRMIQRQLLPGGEACKADQVIAPLLCEWQDFSYRMYFRENKVS